MLLIVVRIGCAATNRVDGNGRTRRPCYFGMCVDPFDNFTSDRIVVGYASSSHGSCVREMISEDIVGTPSDVEDTRQLITKTEVERSGARLDPQLHLP